MIIITNDHNEKTAILKALSSLYPFPAAPNQESTPTRDGVLSVIREHGPVNFQDLKAFFGSEDWGTVRALLATMKEMACRDSDGYWTVPD